MHKEALDKILDLLGGPNEEAAGIEYRKLHERLSRFFEWNGVEDPGALADEAIDRLGRRALEEAATESVRKPSAFALGIARLLLQEEVRRQKRQIEAIRNWQTLRPASTSEDEAMDEALEHCLKKMAQEGRRLLMEYYTYGHKEKARKRQRLTEELGITANSLRNRVFRARQDLEACMGSFLKEKKP
jgi:DNA-directed RNA polymerase specialized sigma24 family protein